MATLTKGKTFTNGELVTPATIHQLVDAATISGIVNADISNTAAIADSKLAQITTAGKVANTATTATSSNAANAIVSRDAGGSFTAGTITAALSGNAATATTAAACSGNAATATTLQTARTINGVSFNGSGNITVTAAPNAHTHAISDTVGLQTALDGKQASGSYAPATHTHAISDTTGLQTALDGKQASGSYAPATHTHAATDISGRFTAFRFGASGEIAYGGFEQTTIEIGTTVISDAGRNSLPGAILARWQRTNNSGVTSTIGTITSAGSGASTTGVAYNTTSDYRLKTNLEPLTDAVARLLQIPARRFNWLADPNGAKVDGFLAHEAQAIVPESVTGHKDEVDAEGKPIHQGIDQSKLVPLLVAAVQELAARVAALEAR